MPLRDHIKVSVESRIYCGQDDCHNGDLIRDYDNGGICPSGFFASKGWTTDDNKPTCPQCAVKMGLPLSPEATPEMCRIMRKEAKDEL